jgi:hypothetical protein
MIAYKFVDEEMVCYALLHRRNFPAMQFGLLVRQKSTYKFHLAMFSRKDNRIAWKKVVIESKISQALYK